MIVEHRTSKRIFTIAALAPFLLSAQLLAAPTSNDTSSRGPSAQSALKKSFSLFKKAKTYRVEASVRGGLATNAKHDIKTFTVNSDFLGNVFGSTKRPIMHIPDRHIFKTPKPGAGVIRYSGTWRQILSTREGRKLDRLIDFPTIILQEAVKFSKNARWLDNKEIPEGWPKEERKKKSKKKKKKKKKVKADNKTKTKKKSKSRTTVRNKKASDDGPENNDVRTTLRVEAHPKKALDIWIKRVENSGCMKSG